MTDPIVTVSSSLNHIPGVNKIVTTIRRHFDYEKGNDVRTVERYTVSLYDKSGQIKEYNSTSTIDSKA
jgi:hypothetical protein